ncbi:helix-turn-helix transcriptional regulator [Diaphorobacter caeni]|uniref:helix-turn-helix transcriptional regulator n=1 Tax=Diaphorobacter caeni TaxID=2784387 RepID=UPI00188E0264|nr:AraC family transcriptional regulator [Diaphorobacter caeni]MBF5004600.1 AraC family transcriptional regulator [Diaphorobacter caeni]
MKNGSFNISPCGTKGVTAVTADTTHAFGRHMHDQYGIGVVLRGAQKSLSGRGMVEAQAGDVITVNPCEVHDGTPLGDQGRAWQMLYFDPHVLSGGIFEMTDGRASHAEFSQPARRDPVSAHRLLSLFRTETTPRAALSEIETDEQLLLLLQPLMEQVGKTPPRSTPPGIERARTRIDDAPASPVTLHELAHMAGVSQFQLIRGFSSMTGLTPHAYLVQRRLQMARRLIASGATLIHAAHSAGFADQSHLTRLFVRSYGISPGRYAAAMG